MPTYTVQLDGSTYDIQGGDTAPTEQQARQAVGAFESPSTNNNELKPLGSNLQGQQASPINFIDMLKMAALDDPKSQQTYLESKFKFAEPEVGADGKPTGNFNVGEDPTNLIPIHPGSMGDMAVSVLAKGAAMVPVIAGQIVGSLAGGSVAGPAGMVVGAGAGAAAGKAAENAMMANVPGFNKEKAATDVVINGLFGAAGEGLGQAIGFGAKNYIAPKLAAALDGAMAKSENPSGAVKVMAKIMGFVSNVKKEAVEDGYTLGWKNIYANKANLNPEEITNISGNASKTYGQVEGLAKNILDREEKSLLSSNPDATIKTSDNLLSIAKKLDESTIAHVFEGDGEGVAARIKFREDAPPGTDPEILKKYLVRLGAVKREGGVYNIPQDATCSLSDAVGAKKLFGKGVFTKDLHPTVDAIMKNAIYGEGPSPLHPDSMFGLRNAINDTAKALNHEGYITANEQLSRLYSARDGVIGQGHQLDKWFDITSPESTSKFLEKYHSLDSYQKQGLEQLQKQLGINITKPTREWAVAQAISKASPQMLRLSIVGGLMGAVLPGNPLDRVSRLGLGFGLGSAAGISTMARASESLGANALKGLGYQALNFFAKGAETQTGKATGTMVLHGLVGK